MSRRPASSERSPTCCSSLIAIIGFAPFVIIVIYSTKARIEILQVPPTLDFDIDQIVENYRDVLITRGFLGFTQNSIIVTALYRRALASRSPRRLRTRSPGFVSAGATTGRARS